MLSSFAARVFDADRPVSGVVNLGPFPAVALASGATTVSGMVVSPGLDLEGNIAAQLSTIGIDINCLAHLKWSPRAEPERVSAVLSAVRDALTLLGQSYIRIIDQPPPTLTAFSKALPQLEEKELLAMHNQALHEWWTLNTITPTDE